MTLLRLTLTLRSDGSLDVCGDRAAMAIDIVPVSMEREQDRRRVTTLAARCRSADSDVWFAGAGLLAELAGRSERRVHAWLAWPVATPPPAVAGGDDADCPLGLVTLVAAGPSHAARFSIAWLLVRPDARRRGVATSLVTHALGHARRLGADRVHAETSTSWPAAIGFWQSVGFLPMS